MDYYELTPEQYAELKPHQKKQCPSDALAVIMSNGIEEDPKPTEAELEEELAKLPKAFREKMEKAKKFK